MRGRARGRAIFQLLKVIRSTESLTVFMTIHVILRPHKYNSSNGNSQPHCHPYCCEWSIPSSLIGIRPIQRKLEKNSHNSSIALLMNCSSHQFITTSTDSHWQQFLSETSQERVLRTLMPQKFKKIRAGPASGSPRYLATKSFHLYKECFLD